MDRKRIPGIAGLAGLAIALFYFVAIAPVVSHAQATANNALSIMNLQVSPTPVYAGDNISISFQIYNSYSSAVNDANIQLTSSQQILNVSPGPSSVGLSIYEGLSYNTFSYNIHVPSTLPAGEYTLDVIVTYEAYQPTGTGQSTQLPATSVMPISIYVYGKPSIGLNANPATQLTPGVATTMPITIVNGGTDTARNLSITLLNNNNFTIYGPNRFYVGNLGPGAQSSITATVQPNSKINNATARLNTAITYTAESGAIVNTNASVQFSMATGSPDIVANIQSANPQNLYPGTNQTDVILVQNIGTGTARNLSLRFLNTQSLTFGSISSFFIGTLEPQASATETVYVSANRNASQNTTSLPLELSYYLSNFQTGISKLVYVPISLQPAAVFNVTSVASQNLAPGATYVPLSFTLKNTGNEPAQQVSVSLQTIFPITPVTSTIYINNINPGQGANATFYVNVDSEASYGNYPVVIYEQWRQPNGSSNQQFSSSNNYYAVVGSGSPIGSYIGYGFLVLIVILLVVFRKRIKKRIAQRKKRA